MKTLLKTFVKTFVKMAVKTLVKTFVKTRMTTFVKTLALYTREPANEAAGSVGAQETRLTMTGRTSRV